MAYQINYPQGTLELSAEDTSKLSLSSGGVSIFDSSGNILSNINSLGLQMNQPNPVDGKTNVSRTAVEVKYGEYYHSNTGNGVNNCITQLGVTCENYENAVLTRKTNLNKDGLILYNDQTETTSIDEPIVDINRNWIAIYDRNIGQANCTTMNSQGISYVNPEGSSLLGFDLQIIAKDAITQNLLATTTLAPASLRSDAPVFDFSFNSLTLGGVSGEAGQVFSVDGSGQPVWTTVSTSSETPSLSDVLVDGDADQKPISNVLSVALKESTVANPVVLSQDAGGALNLSSATAANVIDESLDTKQFSGKYLKLSINGTDYYFQAFTVPPS
jgi:hypothetical protein